MNPIERDFIAGVMADSRERTDMAETVKRYKFVDVIRHGCATGEIRRANDGPYIEYADHVAQTAALRGVVEGLMEAIKPLLKEVNDMADILHDSNSAHDIAMARGWRVHTRRIDSALAAIAAVEMKGVGDGGN